MFVCLFGPVSSIFTSLFFTASFLDHNSDYALLLLLFLLLLTVVPSLVSLGYDAVVACSSTVQLLSCLDRALSSLKKKKKKSQKTFKLLQSLPSFIIHPAIILSIWLASSQGGKNIHMVKERHFGIILPNKMKPFVLQTKLAFVCLIFRSERAGG